MCLLGWAVRLLEMELHNVQQKGQSLNDRACKDYILYPARRHQRIVERVFMRGNPDNKLLELGRSE